MKRATARWIALSALIGVLTVDLLVLLQLAKVYWRHGLDGVRHYIAFAHLDGYIFEPRSPAEWNQEALRGYQGYAVFVFSLFLVTCLAVWAYKWTRSK